MHFSFNLNDTIVKAGEVVFENEYGKLVVYPATSRELLWQHQLCNLTWYKPDNTIDVAFRFDDALSGGRVQYWNNDKWDTVSFNYQTYNNKHYYVHTGFNVKQDTTYRFRWWYVPYNTSGKWDLLAKLSSDTIQEALSSGRYILLDPWWNSSWLHRVDYKISSDYVSSTLTNFPVLVNISSSIAAKCDGGDSIRFLDSANVTEFAYEIESWNTTTNRYFVWVNVTSVSSSVSTYFNMYYNNSAASDNQNANGVWDSDYYFVTHCADGSGNLDDKTSKHNNATVQGDPTYEQVLGSNVGYSIDFDGAGDYYILVDALVSTAESVTVEAYVKIDDYSSSFYVCDLLDDMYYMIRYILTDDELFFSTYDNPYHNMGIDDKPSYVDDFRHIVTIWDTTGNGWKGAYLNGTLVNSTSGEDTNSNTVNNILGAAGAGDGSDAMDGQLDEFRVSRANRSSSYCVASYHSINETPGFISCSVEDTYSGEILEPSSFWANTSSASQIDLAWVVGVNSTHTYIERYSSAGWSRGVGTEIYNDTGTIYSDTGRSRGVIYYYQAWGYNSTSNNYSNAAASANNLTSPNNPTNAIGTLVTETSLNVSWTTGTIGVDNTTVVRKSGGYPTSPSDGTEIYNNSNNYYVDTGFATGMYYRLYSYNITVNQFSTGVNAPYGSLSVNVYDENTSSAIVNWSIFISNEDGSQTYESLTNNNTLVVDTANLPVGDNINIIINATDYDSKLFIMDIETDTAYILDAYLSETSATNLYVFYVQNEYDDPIDSATVRIKRYINDSEGYQNVSILLTDANGQFNVYLIPSVIYLIEISKTGYITEVDSDYRPDPNNFGVYYPIIYQLQFERGEPDIIIPSDIIHFNATINASGVITVWYVDSNSRTINTQIRIYQYYNKTLSWNYTDNRVGDDSFSFTSSGYNISMMHKLVLYLNHSDLGSVVLSFFIDPIRTLTLPSTIEGYWDDVFGDFELGWVNTIFLFVPCMFLLIVFGGHHAGLGILSSGMYLGFTTYFLNLSNAVALVSIASMLCIVGFFLIIVKKGRDAI